MDAPVRDVGIVGPVNGMNQIDSAGSYFRLVTFRGDNDDHQESLISDGAAENLADTINAIRAKSAKELSMDGVSDWWRLSGTPDEGTIALLYRDTPFEDERVVLGEFSDGEWRIHIDGQVIRDATHFMLIPPPPK